MLILRWLLTPTGALVAALAATALWGLSERFRRMGAESARAELELRLEALKSSEQRANDAVQQAKKQAGKRRSVILSEGDTTPEALSKWLLECC